MTSYQIFLLASTIVVLALLVSLVFWICIATRVEQPSARKAAWLYTLCFGLYTFGQSLALLQSLKLVNIWYDIPSYAYAIAALIFAFGSYYQYKSMK